VGKYLVVCPLHVVCYVCCFMSQLGYCLLNPWVVSGEDNQLQARAYAQLDAPSSCILCPIHKRMHISATLKGSWRFVANHYVGKLRANETASCTCALTRVCGCLHGAPVASYCCIILCMHNVCRLLSCLSQPRASVCLSPAVLGRQTVSSNKQVHPLGIIHVYTIATLLCG
jgi:hypothetical protein